MARTCLSLLLVATVGIHWCLLQGMAWTGMLLTYGSEYGFEEAVSMTFDGAHPCAMCSLVEQGQAAEEQVGLESSQLKPVVGITDELTPPDLRLPNQCRAAWLWGNPVDPAGCCPAPGVPPPQSS